MPKEHIVTNYMEQSPLEAVSFTASQFIGIVLNCNCVGLLTGVLHEFVSMNHPQRIRSLQSEFMCNP